MSDYKIREIFELSYKEYCDKGYFQSNTQAKAANAILKCKSGKLGFNLSLCSDCGHTEVHNNSCRNRNCPNCQAVLKEVWVDKRRAEVIEAPYFHVVFTIPHELNPLIYCNQKLLYGLFHSCCAEFIRRYLMHVLPSGFQKIRYYGFLNNRMKQKNLTVIFKLQNGRRYKQRYAGLTMAELLKAIWNFDICLCPQCGHPAMKQLGRFYAPPS